MHDQPTVTVLPSEGCDASYVYLIPHSRLTNLDTPIPPTTSSVDKKNKTHIMENQRARAILP